MFNNGWTCFSSRPEKSSSRDHVRKNYKSVMNIKFKEASRGQEIKCKFINLRGSRVCHQNQEVYQIVGKIPLDSHDNPIKVMLSVANSDSLSSTLLVHYTVV